MQKYLNMYVCSRILYIKCIQSEKINVSKNHFFIFLKQTFEMFTLKLPLNVITMN